MKTEFLKELGLEDEVINKIMAENGKDITKEKKKTDKLKTELDGVKTQLTEATETIQSYKDMDIEGIKASAEEYKTKYETDTKALNDKLAEKDYEYNSKEYLSKYKFTSELAKKAVISEFKSKGFKFENGTFLGADDFMKQLKESDPGTFATETQEKPKAPEVVRPGGGGAEPPKMSLTEMMKMANKNQE